MIVKATKSSKYGFQKLLQTELINPQKILYLNNF
jgi:hypothetical protein